MQFVRSALAGALALATASPAVAQDGAGAMADAMVEAAAQGYPALNVTVMQAGEIVWEAESGTQRDALDGTDRDYNIYSISKMLTGLAFARLEQEQGLDLDREIRSIDAGLPEHFDGVTLRQLLSHAGGVRHYTSDGDWRRFNDRRCAAPQDALGHFIDDAPRSAPGESHTYTTFGFTLLSHLLVQVTGTDSYDAAMEAALGEHFLARTDRDGADKAVTYMGEPGAFEPVDLSAECKFGGGGLLASARDLAAMGEAFRSGAIVDSDRIAGLMTPFETTGGDAVTYVYGMGTGWSEESATHYAAHSGGSPGGRAFLLVYVESGIVVAVTSNFDGPNHGQLAIGLAEIFRTQNVANE